MNSIRVSLQRVFLRSLRLFCALSFASLQLSAAVHTISGGRLKVVVDDERKTWQILSSKPDWKFEGPLDGVISAVRAVRGKDALGRFEEISFRVVNAIPYDCSIRSYGTQPIVIFSQKAHDSLGHTPEAFPLISRLPSGLSTMTYSEREFGVPQVFGVFKPRRDSTLTSHSGPVLLYDTLCNACIISPASNFMTASTEENGRVVKNGINAGISKIPRGFAQSAILVVERGINRAWDTWGETLTRLHGKQRPPNDADIGLKYLGYWTDNGATYYYNYDTTKGYDQTLLAVKRKLDEQHVPIRYMQLDSWWYAKGFDNPDGSIDHSDRRIPTLPAGTWNRFGGLTEYAPSKELFPQGIRKFQESLKLPLITHNRWISRQSPYRSEYRVSGIGMVDPRWWDSTMNSIASWGVVTYEQDWLDRIYNFSPDFSSTLTIGREFLDNMAKAARRHKLTLQYCMPLPRHYLQGGSEYSSLTSIRVSGDRFSRERWKEFLYGSRLASALGIWPWCDVFMSRETPNILLATLSAGMVGIGDSIGTTDLKNISRSVRSDGVIVKPDVPLVPEDDSYVNEFRGTGLIVASTFTRQTPKSKVRYVFAFPDVADRDNVSLTGSEIGIGKDTYVYDYFSGTGRLVRPQDTLRLDWTKRGYWYSVFSEPGPTGIAFIGDPDKFVTCGKQRIESVEETKDAVVATLLLAQGEDSVTVCGYSPGMPRVEVTSGRLSGRTYDLHSHLFKLIFSPRPGKTAYANREHGVRRLRIALKR